MRKGESRISGSSQEVDDIVDNRSLLHPQSTINKTKGRSDKANERRAGDDDEEVDDY